MPCAYTLHSNLIPPTDGTNGPTCFCHPTVGNFDVSPNSLPKHAKREGILQPFRICNVYGNSPSLVADWPHCCNFEEDSCDRLRWTAMLL